MKRIKTLPKKIAKNVLNSFSAVFEIADKAGSLSESQIEGLSQDEKLSKFLFYRYCEEFECADGETRTIYTMDDGRKGFILRIYPPKFLSDENERDMNNFFNSIMIPNAVVHVNTFASRNLEAQIRRYESLHNLEKVNIGRRDILKELVSSRVESLREWIEEPMGRNGVRLRNFVNTISVLLPEGIDDEDIIEEYITSENALLNYSPRDFRAEELIPLISEFVNPDDLKIYDTYDMHQQINTQIGRGSRARLSKKNGNIKFGDNWEAVALTTEKYPIELTAFEFQSAFFDPFGKDFKIPLSCPFVCSLVVSFTDIKENAKKVLSKEQWNIEQINSVPDTLEKKKPILRDKRLESEGNIYNVSKLNEFPLKAMWNITVFDKNDKKLKSSVEMIKKKFREISLNEGGQWILKEESYSPTTFFSFLMGLPLQYSEMIKDYLKRDSLLFKSNNATIAPLITENKVSGNSIMMYPGRTGGAILIDLFDSNGNSNTIIIGPPGSGKSFLTNDISFNHLSSNVLVRLIDIGDSYKDFTNRMGGKFVEADDETQLCLNFFTKIATIEKEVNGKIITLVHPDELTTIIPIIGNMLKMDLKSSHSETSIASEDGGRKAIVTLLEEAVQVAYNRQGKAAGMQTIWEYLCELKDKFESNQNRKVVELLEIITVALHDYVIRKDGSSQDKKGKNYEFFNGVNNLDFDNDMFTFELEKLTRKGEDIVEIVSMTVLHQMANEAFFLKARKKLIGIDEAKILLNKKLFVSYIDEFSRRIRKYGGALIIITQYISDFFHNKEAQTIFEGASYKIFLPQEEESIDDAVDTGKLSFNEGKKQLLKSVKSKSPDYNEFLLVTGGNATVVLMKVDKFSYWLYTTKPADKDKIYEAEVKHNLLPGEGAWYMALLAKGNTEEEALKDITTKRKLGF